MVQAGKSNVPGESRPVGPSMAPGAGILTFGLGLLVTHGFGLSLVPALLPLIAADLDAGYTALGLSVAAGLFMYASATAWAGRAVERFDARRLVLVTFAIPALGLLIAATASGVAAIALAAMLLGANAGISWPASVHVVNAAIDPASRTPVLSTVGVGVGLGVIVNGLLVQVAGGTSLTWRGAMLAALVVAVVPAAIGLARIPAGIARPPARQGTGYRAVLRSPAGRVVLAASLAGGVFGFPFVGFLSAIAIDEMGAGAATAALLWWLMGGAGSAASVAFGHFGRRRGALTALVVGAAAFTAGFAILAVTWTISSLGLAVVLFTAFYYPMWGLVGALAGERFEPGLAVRAVSTGLIGAALGGTIGNTVVGAWFDATASFRAPAVAIAAGMGMILVYLARAGRNAAR